MNGKGGGGREGKRGRGRKSRGKGIGHWPHWPSSAIVLAAVSGSSAAGPVKPAAAGAYRVDLLQLRVNYCTVSVTSCSRHPKDGVTMPLPAQYARLRITQPSLAPDLSKFGSTPRLFWPDDRDFGPICT